MAYPSLRKGFVGWYVIEDLPIFYDANQLITLHIKLNFAFPWPLCVTYYRVIRARQIRSITNS